MSEETHPRAGSHYVTAATARRAVAMTAPMIEMQMMDRAVVGSGFLYIVVMDPGRPPGVAAFEDAVLYEQAFGDRTKWDADYAAFARTKARLSWSMGRDASLVQQVLPHLLCPGDTVLSGAVCLDGIVVAASGAFPVFDEMFAGAVAVCIRALARQARMDETAGVVLDVPNDRR